jgi:hypothetical protein
MGNYPPTVKGYSYAAEIWCPPCLIERLIREGRASPAARDMMPEDVLDQVAEASGIDRTQEWLFDSLRMVCRKSGGERRAQRWGLVLVAFRA